MAAYTGILGGSTGDAGDDQRRRAEFIHALLAETDEFDPESWPDVWPLGGEDRSDVGFE